MKIILEDCSDVIDNWFCIIRAEHDGKEWHQEVSHNCFQLMISKRLSPEACIEGDKDQMIEIANAIQCRGSSIFKRCAVRFENNAFYFSSPKNSDSEVEISVEDADEFAFNVLNTLK